MAMPKPFLVAALERANRRADKAEESAPTSHNTGSPKLRENTMELLEAVSTIIGGTSVPSREELDCAADQLDICIAQLRASA